MPNGHFCKDLVEVRSFEDGSQADICHLAGRLPVAGNAIQGKERRRYREG